MRGREIGLHVCSQTRFDARSVTRRTTHMARTARRRLQTRLYRGRRRSDGNQTVGIIELDPKPTSDAVVSCVRSQCRSRKRNPPTLLVDHQDLARVTGVITQPLADRQLDVHPHPIRHDPVHLTLASIDETLNFLPHCCIAAARSTCSFMPRRLMTRGLRVKRPVRHPFHNLLRRSPKDKPRTCSDPHHQPGRPRG